MILLLLVIDIMLLLIDSIVMNYICYWLFILLLLVIDSIVTDINDIIVVGY